MPHAPAPATRSFKPLQLRRLLDRAPLRYAVLEYDSTYDHPYDGPGSFFMFPNGFDKHGLRNVPRWWWFGDRWRFPSTAATVEMLDSSYGDHLLVHENARRYLKELLGYDPSVNEQNDKAHCVFVHEGEVVDDWFPRRDLHEYGLDDDWPENEEAVAQPEDGRGLEELEEDSEEAIEDWERGEQPAAPTRTEHPIAQPASDWGLFNTLLPAIEDTVTYAVNAALTRFADEQALDQDAIIAAVMQTRDVIAAAQPSPVITQDYLERLFLSTFLPTISSAVKRVLDEAIPRFAAAVPNQPPASSPTIDLDDLERALAATVPRALAAAAEGAPSSSMPPAAPAPTGLVAESTVPQQRAGIVPIVSTVDASLELATEQLLQRLSSTLAPLITRVDALVASRDQSPGSSSVREPDVIRNDLCDLLPFFTTLESKTQHILVECERYREMLIVHGVNDWSPVVNGCARAVEVEAVARILKPWKRYARETPPGCRDWKLNRSLTSEDPRDRTFNTLRGLLRIAAYRGPADTLDDDRAAIRRHLASCFPTSHSLILGGSREQIGIQPQIEEFWSYRNPATHDGFIERRSAELAVELVLGSSTAPGLLELLSRIVLAPSPDS